MLRAMGPTGNDSAPQAAGLVTDLCEHDRAALTRCGKPRPRLQRGF
jgi:hypothetical protein